jgi:hypothetical protein
MYLEQGDLKRIKFVDLSFVNLPKKVYHPPPGRIKVENINTSFSSLPHVDDFKRLLTPEILNVSGVNPHVSSIWIKKHQFYRRFKSFDLHKRIDNEANLFKVA